MTEAERALLVAVAEALTTSIQIGPKNEWGWMSKLPEIDDGCRKHVMDGLVAVTRETENPAEAR